MRECSMIKSISRFPLCGALCATFVGATCAAAQAPATDTFEAAYETTPPECVDEGAGVVCDISGGRAAENVVLQADDAFGATIGQESIGIYSADDVRGFSAIAAGNARIEGLYFDQIAGPSRSIRSSTAIRVGLSALDFPFPAPTGVVDYALIRPGSDASYSATVSADSYNNVGLELDFSLPLAGESLAVGGGAGLFRNAFVNGATRTQTVVGLSALWKPVDGVEVQPFWTGLTPMTTPSRPITRQLMEFFHRKSLRVSSSARTGRNLMVRRCSMGWSAVQNQRIAG